MAPVTNTLPLPSTATAVPAPPSPERCTHSCTKGAPCVRRRQQTQQGRQPSTERQFSDSAFPPRCVLYFHTMPFNSGVYSGEVWDKSPETIGVAHLTEFNQDAAWISPTGAGFHTSYSRFSVRLGATDRTIERRVASRTRAHSLCGNLESLARYRSATLVNLWTFLARKFRKTIKKIAKFCGVLHESPIHRVGLALAVDRGQGFSPVFDAFRLRIPPRKGAFPVSRTVCRTEPSFLRKRWCA